MAAAKNTEVARVESEKSTALVAAGEGIFGEIENFTGAGSSSSADDNIMPFIVLLQALSPQINARKPEYIEGAKAGMLLHKATGEIWDDGELVVQPIAFTRVENEWIPRKKGGGYVARHELGKIPDDVKEIEEEGDDGNKRKKRVRPNGNEIIDTRYQVVNIISEDGQVSPAVMSFSSTGHTAHREWNTLMQNSMLGGRTVDSWFKKYRVSVRARTNTSGDFFVLKFLDDGLILSEAEIAALESRDMIKKGSVKPTPNAEQIRAAGARLHASYGEGTVQVKEGGEQDGETAQAAESDI